MPIGSLWLPVLVSAVVVFVLSAIIHMALPWHKMDYKKLANEDEVRAAVSKGSPAPGFYVMPHCGDMSKMKDPAMVKKFVDGPVASLTVRPSGPPSMGTAMLAWFLLCLFVSVLASYIARHTLSPGADPMQVLRITGAVAFGGYALGYVQDSIWKGIPWSNSIKGIIDGTVYALATGLIFRMCWPPA